MDGGDRILVAAGLTAAVVVGAFVLWGPGGAPKVRKRRGQIAGLQNLGRTCFLNTLLQALAACPTFIDWLRKYAKADAHNSMITTLYTVIEVVNGTHESARGTPVCPLGVLQSLRAAGWVVPADQQDAHELLHVLLACIEEETSAMSKKPGCLSDALGLGAARAWSALASPASPPSAPLRPARPASAAPAGEPALHDPEPPEAPPARLCKGVSRSFCHLSSVGRRWAAAPARPAPQPPSRGALATRTRCTVCATKSPVRYDKFDSISLSMANASTGLTGAFSLSGLLRAFTAPETVSGVRCSKCCPEEPPAAGPPPRHAYTEHIRTVNFGKVPRRHTKRITRAVYTTTSPHRSGRPMTARVCSAPGRSCRAAWCCRWRAWSGVAGRPPSAPTTWPSRKPSRWRPTPPPRASRSRPAPRPPPRRATARSTAWPPSWCTWGDLVADTSRPTGVGTGSRVNGEKVPRYKSSLQTSLNRDKLSRRDEGKLFPFDFQGIYNRPLERSSRDHEDGDSAVVGPCRRWWYTSDTLVHEVSLAEVLRCSAYMLFYERSGAPPPPLTTHL